MGMHDFRIDQDEPMPSEWYNRPVKYPVPDMHVGDSFFVPGEGRRGPAKRAANRYGHKHGMEFKPVPMDGGVRIYRTS